MNPFVTFEVCSQYLHDKWHDTWFRLNCLIPTSNKNIFNKMITTIVFPYIPWYLKWQNSLCRKHEVVFTTNDSFQWTLINIRNHMTLIKLLYSLSIDECSFSLFQQIYIGEFVIQTDLIAVVFIVTILSAFSC